MGLWVWIYLPLDSLAISFQLLVKGYGFGGGGGGVVNHSESLGLRVQGVGFRASWPVRLKVLGFRVEGGPKKTLV